MSKFILLATYNGASFLPTQLDSILSQAADWKLLVRDDDSSDGSKEIIREKAGKSDAVYLLDDERSQLGVQGNFTQLLDKAKDLNAEYCFLSDQDDVWLPSKIKIQYEQMVNLEKSNPRVPILVYSDMEVVDHDLTIIHSSFMQFQGIHHEEVNPLRVLFCQNFVAGCTVMVNRPLLELALPLPKEALMHDWWLALCAVVFGRLEYNDLPLVKYRQHGGNKVGIKNFRQLINSRKTNWYYHWLEGRDSLAGSMLQAKVLADRMKERDPGNPYLPVVEEYASLMELSPLRRIWKVYEMGVHMQSPVRQLLLLSKLLFLSATRRTTVSR